MQGAATQSVSPQPWFFVIAHGEHACVVRVATTVEINRLFSAGQVEWIRC